MYKAFEEEERRKEDFFFLRGKGIFPVFSKAGTMTAVGFGEEDVASREAREGSSERIHPLCPQC